MKYLACGLLARVALTALALVPMQAQAQDRSFERELFKTRFEHEVKFRAAAVQVAWGAEALCDVVTEIEPLVLLSVHALRRGLPAQDLALYREVTGMDEQWRVVWLDESAPAGLKRGDAVQAINGRPLPGSATRFELGAVFRGELPMARDDAGFWDVVLKAREEAAEGKPYTLTLADGRALRVDTQTGCAGGVTASTFDADPNVFWRQGTQRVKIPANAVIEARTQDEFRWLAAFGVYFQASLSAHEREQASAGRSTGFVVGKILTVAVPGAGMLLSAAQAQADRALAVDSAVGSADFFATEVVVALGGDAAAGLRLNERMAARGLKVDVVMMDAFRRSSAAEHVRRLQALQRQQAEKERLEAQAQEALQMSPPAQAQPPGR